MSRLVVTVSALRAIDRRVAAAAADIRHEISAIDDLVDGLEGRFEGQAADRYAAAIDGWVTEANGLIDAITGLGDFLSAAATAVQDVDTKLAEALTTDGGGGGASDQITADGAFLTGLSTRIANIADELERAERMFDGGGFASDDIDDALGDFRRGWSDARSEMTTSLRAARDMTTAAAELFEETDSELTKALQG